MIHEAAKMLSFDLDRCNFKEAAENLVSLSTRQQVENKITRLQKIIVEKGECFAPLKNGAGIPQVVKKFKSHYSQNSLSATVFTRRELRTLTYGLSYSDMNNPSIFSDSNELKKLFQCLEVSWKDYLINGLLDCLLRNWESPSAKSLNHLRDFISRKVRGYRGSRRLYLDLQQNIRLFEKENGPLILGTELATHGIALSDALKYCSLPDDWIKYTYFSSMMVAYIEKRKKLQDYYHDLEKTLANHNNSITNRRVIPKLIMQCNESVNAEFQSEVKALAIKTIGDPGKYSNWTAFEHATEDEVASLAKAKTILNEWITREFITVFFEKCIHDSRRKNFWLKYASKVSSFKVFGPSWIKSSLKADERVSSFVDSRYSVTYSNKSVAAFMLVIGEYKLIEFSDPGFAFYAYKNSNPYAPQIDKRYNSVEELRDGSLSRLIYRSHDDITDQNAEGSLPHQDGTYRYGGVLRWETIFEWWIKDYVKIKV